MGGWILIYIDVNINSTIVHYRKVKGRGERLSVRQGASSSRFFCTYDKNMPTKMLPSTSELC